MSMEGSPDVSLTETPVHSDPCIFRDAENHLCSVMTPADVTLHINPAVLEGVHHPSERAALVFTDALHAAEEYYRLFFTNVHDIEAGLRRRLASAHHRNGPPPSETCLAEGLEWVNELSGGSSASSSDAEADGDGAKADGADDADDADTPPHLPATPPNHGQHRPRCPRRRRAARLVHVHNTPYHTFFPPPISGRHSRAIIRSLLQGRTPQDFTRWSWSRTVSQGPAPVPGASAGTEGPAAGVAAPHSADATTTATATATTTTAEPTAPSRPRERSCEDASAAGVDVTSLGTASDSPMEAAPPHADETVSQPANTTTTDNTTGSRRSGGLPPAASAAHLAPSVGTLPERAQSDFNLAAIARSHTSTRSRVESRYDRYDALAQAQAIRPHTAAATAVVGPRGKLPLTHLPDLLSVSPTTGNEDAQAFHNALHSNPSTRLVTPVSAMPMTLSRPLTPSESAEHSAQSMSPTSASTSKTPTTATATATRAAGMPFDVLAINAIADPIERAQRMSELYEAVLETCKVPLLPVEVPPSPMSSTDRHLSGANRAGAASALANLPATASGTPSASPVTGTSTTSNSMASGVNALLPPPTPFFTSSFLGENDTTYMIPTSQQGPEYFTQTGDGRKPIIIIMVGLPARGKTFLAQKMCRLLGWHGTKAKVHNVQVAWRRVLLDYEATKRLMVQSETTKATRAEAGGVRRTPRCEPSPPPSSPCGSMAPYVSSPSNSTARDFPVGAEAASETSAAAETAAAAEATATTPTPAPASTPSPCLTAEHFRQLLLDPESAARCLYRYVLRGFAEDCRTFFESGGEVVVINDDFVTEELRLEAEALFQPYASQLFYMEVQRDEDRNTAFNECKIHDPTEYPHDQIPATAAKRDFEARMTLLQTLYETLSKDNADGTEDDGHDDGATEDAPAVAGACRAASHKSGTLAEELHQRAPCAHALRRAVRRQHRLRYVKITNSSTMETHGISGYTASNIVSYVLNLSQVKMQHPIYFVRHGESCYNLEDRIGGDPLLTDQGMRDSAALLEFLTSLKAHLATIDDTETTNAGGGASTDRATRSRLPSSHSASAIRRPTTMGGSGDLKAEKLEIWTSQLRRAIQTAELSERLLDIKTLRWSSLNEIHAGVCEDMTYAEVKRLYPLIDHFRKQSKYTYRYPDGESYQDLVVRLEPVIMELENADKAVVVVAHQAVLRCLLAYFGSVSAESSVRMKVPHRTVWRCTYDSKGIASLEELVLQNKDAGFRRVQRLPGVDDSLFVSEENIHVDPSLPAH